MRIPPAQIVATVLPVGAHTVSVASVVGAEAGQARLEQIERVDPRSGIHPHEGFDESLCGRTRSAEFAPRASIAV